MESLTECKINIILKVLKLKLQNFALSYTGFAEVHQLIFHIATKYCKVKFNPNYAIVESLERFNKPTFEVQPIFIFDLK